MRAKVEVQVARYRQREQSDSTARATDATLSHSRNAVARSRSLLRKAQSPRKTRCVP